MEGDKEGVAGRGLWNFGKVVLVGLVEVLAIVVVVVNEPLALGLVKLV